MRRPSATPAALVALLAAAADAQLVANAPKQPHELNVTTDLCVGRTSRVHRCSVLLDVPTACATDSSSPTSACPIVLMLHDEGRTGHAFVPTSPSVHGAGVIAIYPTAVSAAASFASSFEAQSSGCTDNAATMHKATPLPPAATEEDVRVMFRVTLKGRPTVLS